MLESRLVDVEAWIACIVVVVELGVDTAIVEVLLDAAIDVTAEELLDADVDDDILLETEDCVVLDAKTLETIFESELVDVDSCTLDVVLVEELEVGTPTVVELVIDV